MSAPPIHVFVMCQGDQKRLNGRIVGPKQLLDLEIPPFTDLPNPKPTSENGGLMRYARLLSIPIAKRTLRLVDAMLDHVDVVAGEKLDHRITVVGDAPIARGLFAMDVAGISSHAGSGVYLQANPHTVKRETGLYKLDNPGNSSIKGIRRSVFGWGASNPRSISTFPPRVVILLGDVVYSWDCLATLFDPVDSHGIRFVGSPTLSQSDGEIFGIAMGGSWPHQQDGNLMRAIEKHPPDDNIYQPGQIRRWLWEVLGRRALHTAKPHGGIPSEKVFTSVHDYTDDIDVPKDLDNLPALARAAFLDDRTMNLPW